MDYSHGVVHTPSSVQLPKWDIHGDIAFVRIYWLDFANIRRVRIIPIDYFRKLLESKRPGVNIAKVCLGIVGLTIAPGFFPFGEYLYSIDLPSLRPCPFAPGHMAVLGYFEEKSPVPGPDGDLSVQVDLCPRTLLRRILDETKQACKTEYLVGFETEFILLKSTDPVEAGNIHDWSASSGLLHGSTENLALEEMVVAIVGAGIPVEMYHPEAAPGQYEIVSGPLSPMDATDALIFTREIIVQIASKHGLVATFAPRPFMYSAGSSTHAHISVHSSASEKVPGKLSAHESAFVAGVLDHLPAFAALTLPTSASYKRMADGVWSGGTYVCWGTENREAPVRLTNVMSTGSRNFEVRFIDGTANPHLALAGMFAGALAGLREMKQLKIKDCPGPASAAQLSEVERQALGITKRMPLSIEEARKNFQHDEVLGTILGKDFVEKYISVNTTLDTCLILPGETEQEQLTRLVKFY
ncbi:hypothetical protein C8F01DRAFT_1154143 [Mycena amicta]|nr:hypothetical protein C8F01DRAFT_1154143 [Mycena amicta]